MSCRAVPPLLLLAGCGWASGAAVTETTQIHTARVGLRDAARMGTPIPLRLGRVFPDEPLLLILEAENDTGGAVRHHGTTSVPHDRSFSRLTDQRVPGAGGSAGEVGCARCAGRLGGGPHPRVGAPHQGGKVKHRPTFPR